MKSHGAIYRPAVHALMTDADHMRVYIIWFLSFFLKSSERTSTATSNGNRWPLIDEEKMNLKFCNKRSFLWTSSTTFGSLYRPNPLCNQGYNIVFVSLNNLSQQ